MKPDHPRGWYAYIILIGTSSLLTLSGLHRAFYSLLGYFSPPDILASCLTGLMNLSWFELGYVVGGGLKNVTLFEAIPMLGGGLGLLSVALLLTRFPFRRLGVLAFLAFSITLAILSLLVLSWRLWRGLDDYWRLATAIAFLITHIVWFLYFQRTRRFFPA